MDSRRHAPIGRPRVFVRQDRSRPLPQVYLGRQRQKVKDVYLGDHHGGRVEGRFRWFISTCLAAAVGVLAIGVVITGSLERGQKSDSILPDLPALSREAMQPLRLPRRKVDGLKWAVPRTDRLSIAAGVLSSKNIIHESMRIRSGAREMIKIKPYARLSSRLAGVPGDEAGKVPPFNPLKLYSASAPSRNNDAKASNNGSRLVTVKVLELLGGILPDEDGQVMDDREVAKLVSRAGLSGGELVQTSFDPTGAEYPSRRAGAGMPAKDRNDPLGANVSVLTKTTFEAEAGEELQASEIKAVTVKKGNRLIDLILGTGAQRWQAVEMARAAARIFPAKALSPGQQIYFTLLPSLTQPGSYELARLSVFAAGDRHIVTVARNEAGEFVASSTLIDARIASAVLRGGDRLVKTSLYAGLYHAALQLGVSEDEIMRLLRIHAYDTDFRARLRAGDNAEFFFDLANDEKGADSALGEMLYTALTAGGRTKRFYRFRSSDGRVDYYDERGNNSKKFLTRKPVRAAQLRLTSGYGMRRHPLLGRRKMHNGVDWAAPRGTPIMAAGNGIVEKAGRKGGYGNYVRIRHANGYKTAYGHMQRIARGIRPGTKLRQGQVIGLVGSTGFSSGPHLHFEVLVNNRQIDPMRMQVPRQRRLTGKDLADFQRERARIDDLMRRAPVTRPGQ